MNSHTWWTFAIATFFICFSPGPNMLHMMTSAAHYGLRRTFFSMAGCFLAVTSMIAISIAGIGALLHTSPFLFDLLRYAGAFYLLYLGIAAWKSPVPITIDAHKPAHLTHTTPVGIIFRNGFLIGISNPKALLFAGAFFPQFIDPHTPQLPQLLMLFATFAVIEIGCYSIYALGGRSIAGLLKHATVRRVFNRLTGTMFAIFAVLLVVKSV
jgi:threonine/homoserine/homoserine lactone efflux protein